jgi:hypothetical protein
MGQLVFRITAQKNLAESNNFDYFLSQKIFNSLFYVLKLTAEYTETRNT